MLLYTTGMIVFGEIAIETLSEDQIWPLVWDESSDVQQSYFKDSAVKTILMQTLFAASHFYL